MSMAGLIDQALERLKRAEPLERFGALASLREAMERGEDIGPAEPAIAGALSDKDQDVREKAARLLACFYGRRKEWKKIDALLAHGNAKVREHSLLALEDFAGGFGIREMPNLLKALDDQDFDVRAAAVSLFLKIARNGSDISPAVPALRRATAYGDERVKEKVANALKAYEMRKEPGNRCRYCLDCEAGFGPGKESGKLENLAIIIKSIYCCAGDVTHEVSRCAGCGKHYLSTLFDHSDTDHGQLSIKLLSGEDAENAAAMLKKCPNPEWRLCKCEVHMVYLKDERVPVEGMLKYSSG